MKLESMGVKIDRLTLEPEGYLTSCRKEPSAGRFARLMSQASCKHTSSSPSPRGSGSRNQKAAAALAKKLRLPGFRPGKAPLSIIRSRYHDDLRQDVLETLGARTSTSGPRKTAACRGSPRIYDVHFAPNAPLQFKVDFEVAPELELKEYASSKSSQGTGGRRGGYRPAHRNLARPEGGLINIDPAPVEKGDFAVVSLESLAGVTGGRSAGRSHARRPAARGPSLLSGENSVRHAARRAEGDRGRLSG